MAYWRSWVPLQFINIVWRKRCFQFENNLALSRQRRNESSVFWEQTASKDVVLRLQLVLSRTAARHFAHGTTITHIRPSSLACSVSRLHVTYLPVTANKLHRRRKKSASYREICGDSASLWLSGYRSWWIYGKWARSNRVHSDERLNRSLPLSWHTSPVRVSVGLQVFIDYLSMFQNTLDTDLNWVWNALIVRLERLLKY